MKMQKVSIGNIPAIIWGGRRRCDRGAMDTRFYSPLMQFNGYRLLPPLM